MSDKVNTHIDKRPSIPASVQDKMQQGQRQRYAIATTGRPTEGKRK